jgi:hypothetical protein
MALNWRQQRKKNKGEIENEMEMEEITKKEEMKLQEN